MWRGREEGGKSGMREPKKFEILGEVGFWVRAESRRKAEESAQIVIDKFLDKRLYMDDVLHNPWVEVKLVTEVKD